MRACDYSVFSIEYKTTYHERVSTCGGMDSELTGQIITAQRSYLCVAPSEDFAMAVFKRYHSKDIVVAMINIGQLNDMLFLQ